MSEPANNGAQAGDSSQRDAKGRFTKGHRTPHKWRPGRPKGNIEAKAREATANGQELIDFWLSVLRDAEAKMEYRLKASEHIASWGFVKPKEGLEHDLSDRLYDILARINNAQ